MSLLQILSKIIGNKIAIAVTIIYKGNVNPKIRFISLNYCLPGQFHRSVQAIYNENPVLSKLDRAIFEPSSDIYRKLIVNPKIWLSLS